jgi:hypothetical protein
MKANDDLKSATKAAALLGIKLTGLPALRKAFPKTKLGALVDEYHDVQNMRLAVGKIAAALQTYEKAMQEHIIERVDADAEGGAVGKRYIGTIVRETLPIVEDWDAFYAHIKKTNGFDMLNKAVNRAGVRERWEANKAIPGVGQMQAKKLSVRKV